LAGRIDRTASTDDGCFRGLGALVGITGGLVCRRCTVRADQLHHRSSIDRSGNSGRGVELAVLDRQRAKKRSSGIVEQAASKLAKIEALQDDSGQTSHCTV